VPARIVCDVDDFVAQSVAEMSGGLEELALGECTGSFGFLRLVFSSDQLSAKLRDGFDSFDIEGSV